MSPRKNDKQVTGTYVFGILVFVTLAVVIFFGSGVNPQDKGQIVRVLCAAAAGFAGSFICGKIALKTRSLPGWSNVPITASGGFALFLIVFYSWGSASSGEPTRKSASTHDARPASNPPPPQFVKRYEY